jgi:hypothetical protein
MNTGLLRRSASPVRAAGVPARTAAVACPVRAAGLLARIACRWWAVVAALGLALLTPSWAVLPLSAQQLPSLSFSGQLRLRAESRIPLEGPREDLTSLRTRAGVSALLREGAAVFVQLQDVRSFRDPFSSPGGPRVEHFDLHQGYVELEGLASVSGKLRVGRQEIGLGEQRLLGTGGWSQRGRSFDGIRLSAEGSQVTLDILALRLREINLPMRREGGSFLAAFGTVRGETLGEVDLFSFHDGESWTSGRGQLTFGVAWRGEKGPLSLRLDGALQRGERDRRTVAAWMGGGRARLDLPIPGSVAAWYDHLSGSEDPHGGNQGAFHTLFANNHSNYGFADLFMDIPAHTGGLGLRGAGARLALSPFQRTAVAVDLHRFHTARRGSLTTSALADELDFTLTYQVSDGYLAHGGYSYIRARSGIRELGRLPGDGRWLYLMLTARF